MWPIDIFTERRNSMSDWSDEELSAAVEAYLEMQRLEREKQVFVKKYYYDALAARFNRASKSFEFRMQNISFVMGLMGRTWLTGLKPAKNVGRNVAVKIQKLIEQQEGGATHVSVGFDIDVHRLAGKDLVLPEGNPVPVRQQATVVQHQRSPKVAAWVLQQAKGSCDACDQPAPFTQTSGLPYLEIHHLRRLADGGSDTVTNTVALCPNCHREAHYGQNSAAVIEDLYRKISRLVRE